MYGYDATQTRGVAAEKTIRRDEFVGERVSGDFLAASEHCLQCPASGGYFSATAPK